MEWDFGQDECVFATAEAAERWADEELADQDPENNTYAKVEEAGLATIESIEVVS